jgi:hypothetical protein
MWALNFLPDVFFHMLFLTSIVILIAGFVLGFIPMIRQYKTPIQIIGILLFAVSIWYEGGIAKDREWRARVAEVENKLAAAEAEASRRTVEVVTKVVTRTQVVRERGQNVVQYVDREIVKYNNMCPIPEVVVVAHNAAATNNPELLAEFQKRQAAQPVATPIKDLPAATTVNTADHNELARPRTPLAPKK